MLGPRRLEPDGSLRSFFSIKSKSWFRNSSIRRRSSATFKDSYCAWSRFLAAAEIWPDSSKRWYGVLGSSYLR